MPLEPAMVADPEPVRANHAVRWWLEGYQLWMRAPIRLTAACLAPLIAEGLLQLIPMAGVLLSKTLSPVVTAGVLLGIHEMSHGGDFRLSCVFWGFRRERVADVVKVCLWLLTVFACQLLAAWLVYGAPAIERVVLGQASPELQTKAFVTALILPGCVPATLLMLAMPLVLFDKYRPTTAILISLKRMLSIPGPAFSFMAISACLLGVVLVAKYGLVALLLIQPWATTTSYVAYQRLMRDHDPA